MGRPQALTDRERQEVHDRILAGEKPADLAREFKVSLPTINRHSTQKVAREKRVAHQLVSAEIALRELPPDEQMNTLAMADELRMTISHMATAGKLGAAMSNRLAGMAHGIVAQVKMTEKGDQLGPGAVERLKEASGLIRLANDAAQIPMAMLTGHKEAARRAIENPIPKDTTKVADLTEAEAAQVYQDVMRGA